MGFILRNGTTPPGLNGECRSEGWQEQEVSTDEVSPVIDRLVDGMVTAGYPDRDVFAVRLAVDEALSNAIQHAHRDDPSRAVRIGSLVETEQILLVIEDDGPGFDPESIPDPRAPENRERPGGRGVFLMRHYMTWVRYNERGNCVTLCRRRS
jgi:serine/threonine-protein kinase RsbW